MRSVLFSGLMLVLAEALVCAGSLAGEPMAEIDGEVITAEQVNRAAGAPLASLEEQIYNLRRQKLEAMITGRLLQKEAEKRGVSIAQLLDAEITAKVGSVTEQEIDRFYEENKAHLKGEESTFRERIRAHLQNQKLAARREAFIQSLRSNAHITIHLQPPPTVRLQVSLDGAPVRGAMDAPVTIVEFSDFQCPFCSRAQATLKQLLERYPGKLKLVYRDFPLDSAHPQARQAAEAARCAHDQGKFWEYHDALFSHFPQASPNDLKEYAGEVGLDLVKFEQCVSQGVHKPTVQRDIEEGTRLGVTGTPAFFINGRPFSGAQPLGSFVQVIDDELTRVAVTQK